MHELVEHIVSALTPCYPPGEACAMAYWIIEEMTGLNRFQAHMHPGAIEIPDLDVIIEQLRNNVPIQYVFGHTEWLGMNLQVSPATLIPRPETAELISLVSGSQPRLRVLDVGTGSGCVALALKQRHPNWTVHAMDNSIEALTIAQTNAQRLGIDVTFFLADILRDDISQYDLIVSNPPYIRPSERSAMTQNTLIYEPPGALFVPEADPLLFYRRIAQLHRAPELWFEINENLGDEMLLLMRQSGYEAQCFRDMYDKQRFIHATQR